jgi:multidrug efflux pump subunit AcrB
MKSKSSIENQKEFGLSTWAVNNRKTVYLMIAIIIIGGLFSYRSMPIESFPELKIPEIYIGVAYPGNSPKMIADKITDPIEKELKSLKNLDQINSTSIDGFASIQVKFDFKVTIKQALQEVKDAVDKARSSKDFPRDLPVEPNIFELDFSEMPIMNVNLAGNYSIAQLNEYAELLKDKIEDIPEVSEVDIRGTQEQEMQIMVDPRKAEAVDVSFQDIQSSIANENITMSGGEYLDGTTKRTIQIDGKFKSAEEIGNVIVKQEDYKPIFLKDIAEITFADADTTSYARERLKTVVMLDIKKRSGGNLVLASEKIMEVLAEVKTNGEIPEGISVSVTNDQTGKSKEMVSNLENSIIFGVLLVVGVLLFFMGLRNALFVGIAIPLSMFMSYLILHSMGVTLNTMVLFALVLALGMLVDNGIVVVENIQRLMEEGHDAFTASRKGVGEVAWPIIASTATTLGAFIPLAIWPGLIGEFMKYIPITLIIVLGSSLFVALVVNPVLTAVYMKVGGDTGKKKTPLIFAGIFIVLGILIITSNTGWSSFLIVLGILIVLNVFILGPASISFQNKFLPWLEQKYASFLKFSLINKRPIIFFVSMFGLLFLSIGLVAAFTPKVLFFPESEPNYVNIFVQHPIGTDIRVTNQTTQEIEKILYEEILPKELADTVGIPVEEWIIQSIISQVGEGASDPNAGVAMGNTPHKGRITVNFSEFKFRKKYSTGALMTRISEGLENRFPADISITVDKDNQGPPVASPINIEIGGDMDYDLLIEEAEKLRVFMDRKNVPGVENLKLDIETGKPELNIQVDRDKARLYNTSTGQIANAIRTALFGADVSTFKNSEDTYDMVVRFNEETRNDLDALLNQKLIFRNNQGQLLRIPIRSLIKEPTPTNTYSSVKHKDLIPVVTIFSNVLEDYNANEVVTDLKGLLAEYELETDLPDGLTFKFTGEQEEQQKEMDFLTGALVIAIFIILMIIVAQFNAFSSPVIILFSVVFSLIGVFLGEVIFQMDFIIIMTMIGIISLAGVVVNNAIVLIDYTNVLQSRRRQELELGEFEHLSLDEVKSAIVEAGRTRLRPVLLTAITTVLGLLPLALGINIDFTTLLTEYNANFYVGGDNAMFFGPMSWTIVFGLTFATFLTLVIVPIMYLLFYRLKIWLYKITNTKLRSTL